MSEAHGLQEIDAVEEVDAVVVTDARALPARRTPGQVVATQAAVATTSFVAGLATAVVVAHRRNRKATKRAARKGSRGRGLDVAASRSFLVDVHLLNRD